MISSQFLLIFFQFLFLKAATGDDSSPTIDLITELRPAESFRSFVEYGRTVYLVENYSSRPILELDPGVNLTSLSFRVSIRANYGKRGTLLAITDPSTNDVFMKVYFSQSLYNLYYMMVDISIGNQKVTLNVHSFEANIWLNLIFILTEYRIYLYDQSDCRSGDSESISNVEWPINLTNYSLFLGTTGEAGGVVMTGVELSELLLYSGQQPYSHLCQSIEFSTTEPSVTWNNGLSGSGEYEMSGSGEYEMSGSGENDTTSPTDLFTTVSPTREQNVGSKGEPGEPGRTGPRGPKGHKGETSVVTQVGLKGERGDPGESGITGVSGANGEKGEIGVGGEKGEKGAEIEWSRVEQEIQSRIANDTVTSQSVEPTCDSVRSCMTVEMMNSLQGEKGLRGDKGGRGETGSKGDIGLGGEKGDSGPIGPPGPSGLQGVKGNQGDNGLAGSKGDVGGTGLPGESTVGEKGESGGSGEKGAVGASGVDGVSGPPGLRGIVGLPGTPGVVKFYPGVPGLNGSKGDPGESGEEGRPGIDGIPGDVGLKGEKGTSGTNGTIGASGPPGIGQQGVKGVKGEPGRMNITDDYLKSAVSRIPELVSLKGERGDEGTAGTMGESGRQGFPGIPGTAGPKGEPGAASTGTMVIHARTRQDMAAVDEPGSLVYRSDLEKLAFLSLDGWLEIRASVTPWVEIVDVGETTSTSQPNTLCGNGVLDGEEDCDTTNFNELTCKLLRGDLYEGELRCTSHCTLDLSLCQLSSIVVFGLAAPVSGRLDGITSADGLCNRESDAGYYKAYIYSFNRNPSALVPIRYHFLPVKNTRAETMYDSWAELLRGNLLEDSLVNLVSADGEALTNSGYWIGDRNSNCRNWNSQQATDTAFSTLKNSQGYSQSYSTCNQELSIICVLISF